MVRPQLLQLPLYAAAVTAAAADVTAPTSLATCALAILLLLMAATVTAKRSDVQVACVQAMVNVRKYLAAAFASTSAAVAGTAAQASRALCCCSKCLGAA